MPRRGTARPHVWSSFARHECDAYARPGQRLPKTCARFSLHATGECCYSLSRPAFAIQLRSVDIKLQGTQDCVPYGYPPLLGKPKCTRRVPTSMRWANLQLCGGWTFRLKCGGAVQASCIVPFFVSALDLCGAQCKNNPCTLFWGCGSVGRALPSHGRGRGFDSPHLHHRTFAADSLTSGSAVFV